MRIEQVAIPVVRAIATRPRLAERLLGRMAWGNPFSDETFADPYSAWERVRAGGPVVYSKTFQQWFITGYDETLAVLNSSNTGVADQVDMLLTVRPYNKLSERTRTFFSTWLLLVDPPQHTRLRRLVAPTFTPRRVAALEPVLRTLASDLLDGLGDKARINLAEGFTIPFPIHAISALLGVPPERREWIHKVATSLVDLIHPFDGFDPAEVDAATEELYDYVVGLAAERLADPQPDLITALAQAQSEGDRLSEPEMVAMVGFLLFAGFETTAGAIGNALVALADHPAELARLRSDPELWPNAVEELLRFDGPLKMSQRYAVDDLDVGGHTIPKGSNIVVSLAAANRDPRRHHEPSQLMLDREDPSPISFGHGVHYCIGAGLARLEIRIGLEELLRRFDPADIERDGVRWRRSPTLRGPTQIPLRQGAQR